MASRKSLNKTANAGGYNYLHKDARLQRKKKLNMSQEQIVVIELEGGIIQSIENLPNGYTVLIKDRDIEGATLDNISEDEQGEYIAIFM